MTIQNSGGAGKMTLQVDGVIRAGDPLFDPTNYDYNRIAIGLTAPPAGASMDLRNDLYVEGAVTGRDQLYTEGRLLAESIIVVADSTPSTSQAFSSFGTGTPTSGDITLSSDVFVTGDLEAGQSLYLSKTLYMEGAAAAGADGDQTIFFYDEDSRTTNFIRWDDSRADAACSGTTATSEAMVFNVSEGLGPLEAFLFTQGTDVEFKIDDLGSAALDGTLTQSGACDLAETFIGPEGLEPGTLVALVPGEREAVEATTRPYDPTAVGVPDLVYAMLPPPVAAALGLSEEARLRLRGAPGAGETHAGYGSGLMLQLCALADGAVRRYRAELAAALPKRDRVAQEAAAVLEFQNAVGRVESVEEAVLDYLVFHFRYAALSEDSHEGLLAVAIGAEGGSSAGLAEALESYVTEHPEARRPWSGGDPSEERTRLRAARSVALGRALAETKSFRVRLERRLQRDARRVEEYYEALRREVERRRSRGSETPQLLSDKLRAIDAEKRRRLQDLLRRYTVTLRLDPLAVLAVRLPGLRAQFRLQRRKRERRASLGWNPVARRFDRWLCAACGVEAVAPSLCDDLHLLCPACAPESPGCGRPACPACRSG